MSIKSTISRRNTNMSYCMAVFGRQYRRSSFVGFTINVFNQYSGIAPLVMYCPRLLKQLNEQNEGNSSFIISPIMGSVIITAAGVLGCLLSLCTIQKFGRKTLLVFG